MEYICDRVIVLYLGRVMETGPVDRIFSSPTHPYTLALLAAAPVPDPDAPRRHMVLKGDIPSPRKAAVGLCVPNALPLRRGGLREGDTPLRQVGPDHFKACIRDDIG